MNLKGKTALVTGASGTLGSAIARKLAQGGATLALHYRKRKESVEELAEEIRKAGGKAFTVTGDLFTDGGPSEICRQAQVESGVIDILVNNAGDWTEGPLLDATTVEWDRLLQTDLRGSFLTIRSAAPGMISRGWGRIINISSIASLNYIQGEGVYGVAKAGINMLTKSFAAELGNQGVTVNAVAPGWTVSANVPFPPAPDDYPQCAAIPDRRPGHATEVAAAVAFLASEEATHINGQILCVDGGISSVTPAAR